MCVSERVCNISYMDIYLVSSKTDVLYPVALRTIHRYDERVPMLICIEM